MFRIIEVSACVGEIVNGAATLAAKCSCHMLADRKPSAVNNAVHD
jgi:hypothetical protein